MIGKSLDFPTEGFPIDCQMDVRLLRESHVGLKVYGLYG